MEGYGIEWKILGCSRELWERDEDCGKEMRIVGENGALEERKHGGRDKILWKRKEIGSLGSIPLVGHVLLFLPCHWSCVLTNTFLCFPTRATPLPLPVRLLATPVSPDTSGLPLDGRSGELLFSDLK